ENKWGIFIRKRPLHYSFRWDICWSYFPSRSFISSLEMVSRKAARRRSAARGVAIGRSSNSASSSSSSSTQRGPARQRFSKLSKYSSQRSTRVAEVAVALQHSAGGEDAGPDDLSEVLRALGKR